MNDIRLPLAGFSGSQLTGNAIQKTVKTIGDLKAVFADEEAYGKLPPEQIVYEVQSCHPVAEYTAGGLFFGITRIHPGAVGNEYFMTRGHFHKIENRAEFYWGMEGEGMLILMDRNRNTWAEKMYPGSLHYINGYTAHRTANTGNGILSFGACWPADAGHDYETIAKSGFSKILVNRNGNPALVPGRNKVPAESTSS
jgi:glucose-6-phosphate isomerase